MRRFLNFIPRRLRLRLKGILPTFSYSVFDFHLKIPKSKNPKHYHFSNIVGSHRVSNLLEPSIAKFLILRGHRVSVAICDGVLPACLSCSIWLQPDNQQSDNVFLTPQQLGICNGCAKPSIKSWQSTGAEIHILRESKKSFIIENDYNNKKFVVDGIDLSEDVIAGCLRFLCKGSEHSISEKLWECYAQAALKVFSFYDEFLGSNNVDVAFSVHGIYIPHGITNKIFRSRGITFFNYNTSYRQHRFYFTKNETYHKVFPSETDADLNLELETDENINEIKKYLRSRETGSEDWQQFNNSPDNEIEKYLLNRGLDVKRETAVLFSNVVWDARLHFKENTYKTMEQWLIDTVDAFKAMPERNLVIRTHPGEVVSHSKSRERLRDLEILKNLPANIIFVDADDTISSYGLARVSSLNLVYASKIAMELCVMDAPIITCGDAWINNKNAAITPRSQSEYIDLLQSSWQKINVKCNKRRGLAYAHYVFEKKPLKFDFFKVSSDRMSFVVDKQKLKEAIKNFEGSSLEKIEKSVICDI